MSISSKSSLSLFRSKAGFTLLEMLVSMGILLIIITVAVFRFSSLDSFVLLRLLSYDIGLSIRQAQSYSLSATGNEGDFRIPYGVSFLKDGSSYTFFGDADSDSPPQFDGTPQDILINIYKLGGAFYIQDLCVVVGGTETCGISRIDISFERPEYTSLFYATGNPGSISSAVIKIGSRRSATFVGEIRVLYTGQIEVTLEES